MKKNKPRTGKTRGPGKRTHGPSARPRSEEALLRGLLAAAPDAMVIVGKDGGIVLSNAQAETLFDYPPDGLQGLKIEALVPARYQGGHPAHRGEYFHAPKIRPMGAGMDLYALKRDGSEFPAEISLSPIHTEEGVFVIAAVRDVSERRRVLEEENRRMQESNRLKGEFLANMSHELRTPLNAIIGFSELMVHEKVGPLSPDHKEYLGDILTSARHLLQLINDVLDLTKVEAGKMQFRPEKVDLSRSITEVKEILRGIAGPKKLDLVAQVDPALGTVVLDASKLKQVLYNFLSNAIKFTPEGGTVTVRALPEGNDRFRLEVEDTGIGIQEKDMHKLFIEFQQLDQGVAKKYAGTGLGLALTKRLVEAQGGAVSVRSVYGTGSVFTAVLPRDTSGNQA
ncbi:MAG TPA: ATP-binding protein [bacterium]|nr:ATP-binding protein [bacterium]